LTYFLIKLTSASLLFLNYWFKSSNLLSSCEIWYDCWFAAYIRFYSMLWFDKWILFIKLIFLVKLLKCFFEHLFNLLFKWLHWVLHFRVWIFFKPKFKILPKLYYNLTRFITQKINNSKIVLKKKTKKTNNLKIRKWLNWMRIKICKNQFLFLIS